MRRGDLGSLLRIASDRPKAEHALLALRSDGRIPESRRGAHAIRLEENETMRRRQAVGGGRTRDEGLGT